MLTADQPELRPGPKASCRFCSRLCWAVLCLGATALFWGCAPATGDGERPLAASGATPRANAAARGREEGAAESSSGERLIVPSDAFPDAQTAVDTLLAAAELAQGGNKDYARAQGWLKMHAESAVAPLATVCLDPDASLAARIHACRTLGLCGPSARETLFLLLEANEPLVRLNAIQALGALKPAEESTVARLSALVQGDADVQTKKHAIDSLGRIGKSAQSAGPLLQEILNSDAPEALRASAKRALLEVNPRRTLTD